MDYKAVFFAKNSKKTDVSLLEFYVSYFENTHYQ